jgi:hypothetical protein
MKPAPKPQQILSIKTSKNPVNEQNNQPDSKDIPESPTYKSDEIISDGGARYIPITYKPIIPSLGNSGWQISDVWRDIRVDNFSD